MTSIQVVETSVNFVLSSPSQDYAHLDDCTSINDTTPEFKPFTITINSLILSNTIEQSLVRLSWLFHNASNSRILLEKLILPFHMDKTNFHSNNQISGSL